MNEIHALDVVVHHELQLKWYVGLVRLQHLIHDGPGGQQIRRPLNHVGIVEVEFHKCVLPAVIAVERPTTHPHRLVHVLHGGPGLIQRKVDGEVQAGRQPIDKTTTVAGRHLSLRKRNVQVGEETVQMQRCPLAGRRGTEHAENGHAADVIAALRGEGIETVQRIGQVVVQHHQADRYECIAILALAHPLSVKTILYTSKSILEPQSLDISLTAALMGRSVTQCQ